MAQTDTFTLVHAAPRVAQSLRSTVTSWAYRAEGGRDLRIDLLRGLAVLAMIIDHIAGPSRLYLLTGGNRFYTSAAEAFIFLSGLTVGLVYRRIAEQHGLPTAMGRLVQRAWTLYVLAVGLTLVMLPLSELLNAPWAVGMDATTPLRIVWSIVSLHQTYYLVDVLALYVVLMLCAPLALLLLAQGRTVELLAVSWLIWAGFQFFPQQTELPWTTAGNNLFYLAATGHGQLSVVAVVTALYPAVTVVLARFLLDERWARLQIAGLVMSALAVGLISVS